jgi:hypothetical protein
MKVTEMPSATFANAEPATEPTRTASALLVDVDAILLRLPLVEPTWKLHIRALELKGRLRRALSRLTAEEVLAMREAILVLRREALASLSDGAQGVQSVAPAAGAPPNGAMQTLHAAPTWDEG